MEEVQLTQIDDPSTSVQSTRINLPETDELVTIKTVVETRGQRVENVRTSTMEKATAIEAQKKFSSSVNLLDLYKLVKQGVVPEQDGKIYHVGKGSQKFFCGTVLQVIKAGHYSYFDKKEQASFDRQYNSSASTSEFNYEKDKQAAIKPGENLHKDFALVLCRNGCVLIESGGFAVFDMPIIIVEPAGTYYSVTEGKRTIRLGAGGHLVAFLEKIPVMFVTIKKIKPRRSLQNVSQIPTEDVSLNTKNEPSVNIITENKEPVTVEPQVAQTETQVTPLPPEETEKLEDTPIASSAESPVSSASSAKQVVEEKGTTNELEPSTKSPIVTLSVEDIAKPHSQVAKEIEQAEAMSKKSPNTKRKETEEFFNLLNQFPESEAQEPGGFYDILQQMEPESEGAASKPNSRYGFWYDECQKEAERRRNLQPEPRAHTITSNVLNNLREQGFEIADFIEEGAFAEVYKARQNEREIAVKVIKISKLAEVVKENYLPNEIEIVQKVKHDHIVETISVLRQNDYVFIFTNLAEHDLEKNMLLFGCVLEDVAKEWTRQLVEAVKYLHGEGIAHRDIKIDNVLIIEDRVKLCDFSLAMYVHDRATGQEVLMSDLCGSYEYMAPEILLRKKHDPRTSDIWSLGVVLFIMITWRFPFGKIEPTKESFTRYVKRQRKLNLPYPEESTFVKPRQCDAFIRQLLKYDFKERINIEQVSQSQWLNE